MADEYERLQLNYMTQIENKGKQNSDFLRNWTSKLIIISSHLFSLIFSRLHLYCFVIKNIKYGMDQQVIC